MEKDSSKPESAKSSCLGPAKKSGKQAKQGALETLRKLWKNSFFSGGFLTEKNNIGWIYDEMTGK